MKVTPFAANISVVFYYIYSKYKSYFNSFLVPRDLNIKKHLKVYVYFRLKYYTSLHIALLKMYYASDVPVI